MFAQNIINGRTFWQALRGHLFNSAKVFPHLSEHILKLDSSVSAVKHHLIHTNWQIVLIFNEALTENDMQMERRSALDLPLRCIL